MSETLPEQRTVAEIIGWQRISERDYHSGEMVHWWQPPDYEQPADLFPRPTVDDMLAWLRGRGWHVIAEGWTDDGDIQFTAFHNETGDAVEGTDPTLRTALEVAVRAVDEQIQP